MIVDGYCRKCALPFDRQFCLGDREDVLKDLINCYNVIKQDVETLIEKLNEKEKEFLNIELENRQEYFYKIRSEYNSYKIEDHLDVIYQLFLKIIISV